jgi:hypothetical protein
MSLDLGVAELHPISSARASQTFQKLKFHKKHINDPSNFSYL